MKTNVKMIWAVLLLSALFGQKLQAGPVSRDVALEIGRRILGNPATRSGDSEISIVWDGEFADGTAKAEPAFYVIGRKSGGFVIVSGNDNTRPVLAISETNAFQTDRMPANVRWWMERMKAYVRSQDTALDGARAQWARLLGTRSDDASITGTVTNKVEHLTPEWNQGNSDRYYFKQQVFNKYCPTVNGELTLTGCVPTAVAEVLTTLSGIYPDDMPTKGRGTVGGYAPYNPNCITPDEYELTTVYDWAGLRTLTNTAAINQAIKDGKTDLLDNLGHLMADCGAIIEANYTTQWTSADTKGNITHGMAEHFYMSKKARCEIASSYSSVRWKEMLKTDLASRPIIYSGQDPGNDGHGFVLDGYGLYEDSDVFHVNFGWSGSGNGYYFLDHLDSGNGNFSTDCDTILDFVPDVRQQTSYLIRLSLVENEEEHGFVIPDSIPRDEYIYLNFGRLINTGNLEFNGELRAYLQKKDGELIQIGETGLGGLPSGWWMFDMGIGIYIYEDTSIDFGDQIVLYHSTVDDQFVPVQVATNGTVVGSVPLMPAAFIQTEKNYAAGDRFLFRITNYDGLFAGTTWTITGPDGNTTSLSQDMEYVVLSQPGKYRIEAAIAPAPQSDVVERVVTFVTAR